MPDETTLESEDSLLEALAATPVSVLPRATVIDGQYRIERVLGQGGMGVVYLAHDLRLARDVAIKVGTVRSAVAIGQVAREALALARLSHPNVVVIYQVGELDGRSYVAMEYVPGGTARAWCHDRSWQEIIALYLAAGRGLAAAHAAGLLHRDFKPDNVLVGNDGRPRVADFGLARAITDAGEDATVAPLVAAGSTTKTGAIAGTPAYMAPEQLAGRDIDARADQFAFCASIWEALFGSRPYHDRTTDRGGPPVELVRAVARKVPRHLDLALRRGLREDPEDRWPTLAPLLAELRRDPARRRRSLAVSGATLAVGAGVAAALFLHRARAEDPCAGGAAEIAASWSPQRAGEVRDALAREGAPAWARLTATRTVAALDAWVGRWSTQYRAVCKASRGPWSTSLADRGTECLAQSRRELVATVDVLVSGSGQATADQLVDKLGGPERCSDAAYLAATVPPPTDPMTAARVSAELADLAKIAATELAGQTKQANELATRALARAQQLDYPPLVARVQQRRGSVAMRLGDYKSAYADYHEAYFVARTSRDEETAASSAAGTALALLDLSRDGEAVEWAQLAGVEAGAAADPDSERSAYRALTLVQKARNEPEKALASAESFLALARRQGAAVVDALRARSGVLDLMGKSSAALADLDEGIRILHARYGDHPLIGELEWERALVFMHLHRSADALAAARRGLAIAEALVGPESVAVNNALAVLGTTLKETKQYDEALAVLDRSLALTRAHDGPRSYNTASDLNNRADLLSQMERLDDALASWKESSAIFTEVVGPEGNEVGIVEGNIANALIDVGRIVDAAPAAARALAIMEKTPDSPIYGQALIAIGMIEAERRDWPRAKASLTRGLAKLDDDPRWRSRARFTLAKVALAAGDPAAARTLALGARDDARTDGRAAYITAIDRLLAGIR